MKTVIKMIPRKFWISSLVVALLCGLAIHDMLEAESSYFSMIFLSILTIGYLMATLHNNLSNETIINLSNPHNKNVEIINNLVRYCKYLEKGMADYEEDFKPHLEHINLLEKFDKD